MDYDLVFRRYAPFESFGPGYAFKGDNRPSASELRDASCKTEGAITFSPTHAYPIRTRSSGTEFSFTDKIRATATVTGDRDFWTQTAGGAQTIWIEANSSGSNPLFPGAPPINTYIRFSAVFAAGLLTAAVTVLGDAFPNAEVLLYNGSTSVVLVDFMTAGGPLAGPLQLTWPDSTIRDQVIAGGGAAIPLGPTGAFAPPAALNPGFVPAPRPPAAQKGARPETV